MTDWMKEFEDLFQDSDYVDRREGHWCVDGFVDDEKLKNFIDLVKAEERERIVDEFGDFRMMAKGWFGMIKYGRTLRFFLLPHTKHKKGDDETN